jgi:protein-L-isoaspartate O-methyltransferase
MMGSRALGLSLVLGLVTASLMADRRWLVWLRALVGMVAVVLLCLPAFELASLGSSLRLVYDGDSAYARWRVIDVAHKGQTTRLLTSDWMVPQSGIYLDKPLEPLFGYTRRFLEVARGMPAVKRVLLIGGGTYTFPEMIISKYPEVQVDVVEIDPKLDELAGHYFGYKPDPRVRIIHEDGRTFLNGNRDRYDLVVIDAFSSMVPPFQLTTTEAVDRVAQALNPGGVVAVNLISAREGAKAGFVRAEYATYREHFANVLAVPADGREPAASAQNMVLVASNGSLGRVKGALGLEGSGRVAAARALTDDFAPVEQMTAVR